MIRATLVYGGTGCVAASANVVPGLVVEIYEKYMAGDISGALEAQYRLAPLRKAFNLGCFPAVSKEALNLMGVEVGPPIRPVRELGEDSRRKRKEILVQIGALK
jgi:4-hydroxy-tetrahydrodipicolinate synthase